MLKRIKKNKRKKILSSKKEKSLSFKRAKENPIITPEPDHSWEAWQTFNPGVIFLEGRVHFLYRAVGEDGLSRFGYASSPDGFLVDERLPYPVYEHKKERPGFCYYSFASGGSFGGAEDPRPTRVDNEERIYLTYTACDEGLRVGLTSIKVRDFLKKNWRWQKPVLISPPNEVHKNWVIFPEKINGYYAILHSLSPKVSIAFRKTLQFKRGEYISSFYDGKTSGDGWEEKIKGAGPPPLKTKYGWLLFYHGLDKKEPFKYKIGAMLLDLSSPERVLLRSKKPILEPAEDYEVNGFKPNIVYASGAIIKNGQILIYYGGADSYVCVAWSNFDEFMKNFLKETKPKLKRKILRRKK